ncbi:hypothetical protein [Microbacterium sp. gxy059]|uniref:hypothetical protein n=1 Tax=Microbacterium sp. gxy059 TaxID=2957199 RepID=UPI003D95BE14
MFLLCHRGFRGGDRVGRNVRDGFVLVDDDFLAHRTQQNLACSRFATPVQSPQIGDQISELIEPVSRFPVGRGEAVQATLDRIEIRGDAGLLALEQVERDRVGVAGLDELQPFGFELLNLGYQELALVVGGGVELIEDAAQHGPGLLGFFLGEPEAAKGAIDFAVDAVDHDGGPGAAVLLPAAGAGEVFVPFAALRR